MDPPEAVKSKLVSVLPRLFRYARNLCGSTADAEELLQATCERVLSRSRQYRLETHFDRWAFTIMSSIRSNHLRALEVRQGNGQEDAHSVLTAPDHQSPDRLALLSDVQARVMQLPMAQRQVMVLVYVEGFSYEDTAKILEVPVGTVMSRISRARSRLARELRPLTSEDESRAVTSQ